MTRSPEARRKARLVCHACLSGVHAFPRQGGLCFPWAVAVVMVAMVSPTLARADGGGRLTWSLDAQTKSLTASLQGNAIQWQGERLAEITYWDAVGAERSEPVAPGASWTIKQEPIAAGCRLDCRQERLGLTIRLEFTAAGDVLTARVPAAGIKETGPARLKTLRLLPRFGAAREGDEGYLVIAQQSGALCRFRGKKSAEHWLTVYQHIGQCPMPLFGMVHGTCGVAGIVTSGQYDARICVTTNWGPKQQYAIDPGFTLRSFLKETILPDDLTVEYHFLAGAEADWLGVGKRYRQYNFARRGIRPLRERAAASAPLAYSVPALQVRIRLGVKPVPYTITEQTPETEPLLQVFCNFARLREILDEFHRQGIGRAEFCLIGWNRGGEDGRFPQVFPIEPVLGGEAQLRATIRYARSLGYQLVAQDCYDGAFRISEDWNEEYLRKKPDGQPKTGGLWGGGRSYDMCSARAESLFASRNLPRIRDLGFEGAQFMDVLSCAGPHPCYDPRHPLTRRQDAEANLRILDRVRALFGAAQSEGSLDFAAPGLDRVLYIDSDKWSPMTTRPFVDVRVPLYETVYHGVFVYNLSTEAINSLPGETEYLRNIEYGGTPVTYFYGHFVFNPKANWLGHRDYRYDDSETLKQIVAGVGPVYDDLQRLAHLQMEYLDGHRQLAEDVFETTYSNGQRVVVNYREQAYALPAGQSVPPRGFLLVRP